MKKITASNYKQDKYYEAVAKAVAELLQEKSYVAPVDVFMKMKKLSPVECEDWRFCRIPHLEKAIQGSLSKANRVLRVLKWHAQALGLKPSPAVYRKWGKGKNQIILRFSKFGEPNVELSYSTHYVADAMSQPRQSNREI